MRMESIPMQGIADLATRNALDVLQRNLQFGFGDQGFATKDELAALRRLIGSNASLPTSPTIKVVTPLPPPPVDGDFVKRTGDQMSGRLGITRQETQNATVEGLGILNFGLTTHDRAAAWNNVTTYLQGDTVTVTGLIYQSLQNVNLNHNPASAPTWWQRTALECQTWIKDVWAGGTTYDAYDTVYHVATGIIWTSLQAGNVGHTPGMSPTWWSDADLIDQHCTLGTATYGLGAVVRYGNGLYTSLQAGNLGRYPYPRTWAIAATYALNDQVRYANVLYTSLANGNVGHQPDVSPLSWVLATSNIWWAGSTPVLNGVQSNSFGLNGQGIGVSFGMACEAWNGPYPTTLGAITRADRTLVGIEPSVINRNPYSTQAKVAVDYTFKNRADTEYFTAMPLGDNKYNIHARASQYSAFPRSATGEYCGWPILRKINSNATDITADQPFTVDTDMYDQSVGNDGSDTWWRWWASANVYDPVGQPLGREAGIRYNRTSKQLEFYSDIVNQGGADSLVATISFDPADWADTQASIPTVLNRPFSVKRHVFNESIKFISVGPLSGHNYVSASATGAGASPFAIPGNFYPVGFLDFYIDGSAKKIGYYNP